MESEVNLKNNFIFNLIRRGGCINGVKNKPG